MIGGLFDEARRRDCDAVVTVYHSCYRELCGHEAEHGLEVLNYIEPVCQGMGLPVFSPRFKQLRLEGDPRAAFGRLGETARRRNVSPKLVERSLHSHFGRPPAGSE